MSRTLIQRVCPRDRRPLHEESGAFRCPACERAYPIEDGVPDFRRVAERAQADAAPLLDKILNLLHSGSPDAAAAEFCRRHAVVRQGATTDLHGYVSGGAAFRILEIGAGFGDDTLALARGGAVVRALMPNRRNARVVERRLRERSDAVSVDVVHDLSRLPIATDGVDAILAEEVGLAAFGPGAHALDDVVAEWRRVLAPSGRLVLGLGNRLHRLPGLAKLRSRVLPEAPETLNRRIKRAAGGDSERLLGLRRTLRSLEAHGLPRPQVFAPLPDPTDVGIVIPIEDRDVVRYCFGRLLRRNSWAKRQAIRLAVAPAGVTLMRALVPSYYLVSYPRDASAGAPG